MSFLALRTPDGTPVLPEEVDNGVDVKCPECGELMRGRGPSKDGRARHFFHLVDTDCPGGESEIHRKQKSLAASALRIEISDFRRCELEVDVDVSDTRTGVNTRRADVLLEFKEDHSVFGRGIIVEVQYKNHNKNIPATTFDYLSKGYSIIWADQDSFTDRQFLLSEVIAEFDDSDQTYRPAATDPSELLPLDPPTLAGTKHYFDERATGPDLPSMRSQDNCDHRWVEQREFCYTCAECDGRLHANPTITFSEENDQEYEPSHEARDKTGYVISLEGDVSFEELSTFRARGLIVEIRSELRDCHECGEEYEHVIGWDGHHMYSPGRLREQIKDKSYTSLRKVNGSWKRCCPKCGAIKNLRGTQSAELYYCSRQIDTVWIPREKAIRWP